jgi:hypothetical protein
MGLQQAGEIRKFSMTAAPSDRIHESRRMGDGKG